MEDQLNSLAITHLLQHTLRSLCIHDSSHWVYAVFWRILPRNYPPPKWDLREGAYDRTRGNTRNWILVWEDGFCNFDCSELQPELFFKMSHEIYSYGEGLIGKVAADRSHKWVYKDPQDHEINFLSAWNHAAAYSHPRTWEAQFQSGIKTIALIAVREGVVQLGASNKVAAATVQYLSISNTTTKMMEDLSFIVLLRRRFSHLQNIPGSLLPHPTSSQFPMAINQVMPENWPVHEAAAAMPPMGFYNQFSRQVMPITPSMSSLECLLSKLPSVGTSMGYSGMPMSVVANEDMKEEKSAEGF